MCAATPALLGLTAYEILFEAHARYLFIYAPIFILPALLGRIGICKTVVACKQRGCLFTRFKKSTNNA